MSGEFGYTVRAHAAPWRECVELLIAQLEPKTTGGLTSLVPGHLVTGFITQPLGGVSIASAEPSLRLNYVKAQTLMDDLWDAGLRPTEGTGSAGSLAATQKHLEDMRKLVFEGLKVHTWQPTPK